MGSKVGTETLLFIGIAALVIIVYAAFKLLNAPGIETAQSHEGSSTREWLIGVAGESHRNADGSSRQSIIGRCSEGETICLIREPDNPYSSDAIKVCRENGEQIGYIPSSQAARMAPEMDAGYKYTAVLNSIHGGTPDKPSFGVVIRVSKQSEVVVAEV